VEEDMKSKVKQEYYMIGGDAYNDTYNSMITDLMDHSLRRKNDVINSFLAEMADQQKDFALKMETINHEMLKVTDPLIKARIETSLENLKTFYCDTMDDSIDKLKSAIGEIVL
jgi:hypothetical protein